MNIDPRNPMVRYVDKVILVLAVLVAVTALLKMGKGPSPARDAVQALEESMGLLEKAAEQRKPAEYPEIDTYDQVADRFHRSTIDKAIGFRDYVFSRPDEVIGTAVTVEFREDVKPELREPTIVRIAEQEVRLRSQDYDRARVLPIIGDTDIARIEVDKKKKQLELWPIYRGQGRVRVEFPTGASYEFHLTVSVLDVPKSPEPKPPVMVDAQPGKGYVTIFWRTNEQSCPAHSYKIYRAEAPDSEKLVVHEYMVEGAEKPPAAVTGAIELGKPTVRGYWWDDFSAEPGKPYIYEIETTGYVLEAETKTLEASLRRSETKPVSALEGLTIRLVGGYGDMADLEVEQCINYLPSFDRVRAWVGETVASRTVDTGYRLIDVESRMLTTDDARRQLLRRRAILLGPGGRSIELFQEWPRKSSYEKEVRELFTSLHKAGVALPAPAEKKTAAGKIQIALINTTAGNVQFAFLSSKDNRYMGELRHGETRRLEFSGREIKYDLAVRYPDGSACSVKDLQGSSGKVYEFKILPPATPGPAAGTEENKEEENAPEAG